MNSTLRSLCVLTLVFLLTCAAQSPPVSAKSGVKAPKQEKASSTAYLVPVKTIESPSEMAAAFVPPLTCDTEGNLYLQSDDNGASGIRKISPKGERVTVFQATANPDLQVGVIGHFNLDENGDLYQLVFSTHEVKRYVMVYKTDGTYKSTIKLQPGFPFTPRQLAVFPSGNLVVSGLEYDNDKKKAMWPFTGIFSSDGSLLKEVKLEDDDTLHDLAASGDSRVSSITNPLANHAVEFGLMNVAKDGNAYLMRWITPTLFYAISAGGSVERRFIVDPGDESYRPAGMHIAGNRIAVLYFQPQTREKRMMIVDLEGREIARYDEPREGGKPKYGVLGTAFACYGENPQQFTFLGATGDDKLQLTTAEAR